MTTFRSDDGRELQEEDVRALAEWTEWVSKKCGGNDIAQAVLAALAQPAPTCGAHLEPRFGHLPCVLPPPVMGFHEGHHTYNQGHYPKRRELGLGCDQWLTSFGGVFCNKPESDPVHSPGHQVAAECWVMP